MILVLFLSLGGLGLLGESVWFAYSCHSLLSKIALIFTGFVWCYIMQLLAYDAYKDERCRK